MPAASLFLFLGFAMATPGGAAAAGTTIQPESQQGIIIPKDNPNECFVDENQKMRGSCKLQQDCPTAFKQAKSKTCYSNKYDKYVCCASRLDDGSQLALTTRNPSVERRGAKGRDSGRHVYMDIASNSGGIMVPPIVGGRLTQYREFPFMAALGWRSNFDQSIYYHCGGTLIANNFVLTAAHCIDFGGQMPVTVRLGGDSLATSYGRDYKIRQVFSHPNYNVTSSYNDIALLELEGRVMPTLRPVCLWQDSKLTVKNLTALGYGQIRFTGVTSSDLLQVDLQHIGDNQCRAYYSREQLDEGLAASQICAGDSSGKADTCQGDSGGPLLMQNRYGTWYLVGITSLGQGCATGPPSIYTRVSSYLDWIERIVWPEAKSKEHSVHASCDLQTSRPALPLG